MDRTRAAAAARLTLLTLLVLALLAAAGLGGYLITWHLRSTGARAAAPASAPPRPSALNAATRPATPEPSAAGGSASPGAAGGSALAPAAVARAIRPLLADPALGGRVGADVIDPATGKTVYAAGAQRAVAPASTAKLLTASAVLSVLPATYRIVTAARLDGNGTLVVVGGGDPTLSAAAPGTAPLYPDAARLSDLAAQIRSSHRTVHRIVVDDALFRGPSVSPAWAPEDVPSSYASAITPFMADGGRAAPGGAIRSATPDLAAAHELARLLHHPGLPVRRSTTGAHGGRVVGQVRSAPVSVLIEEMLQQSDNVIAECLARQVALAVHRPASFLGAAAAIRQVVGRIGISVGDGMRDGSGLAASDRLTPSVLVAVLDAIVHRQWLAPVAAGLPVAGWSGTLIDRYVTGTSAAAAGVVRAKTGTLTGVSTLAGFVHDSSGRLVVFALMADHVRSTPAAESALDDVAARLARCGCGRSGG